MENTIFNFLSQIFKSNGFDLFLVGGAVRDFLLNREISDFDFVTNALPDDLLKLFPSGNKAFIKYGVIIVEVENKKIEIASFRKEVYLSPRKDVDITFGVSMEEDSLRRDFSVNALYMDENYHIYDFHNGLEDLKNKKIKVIGDIEKRFIEDPLRILRGIRFALQLEFELDDKLINYFKNNMELIRCISYASISKEINKMIQINEIGFKHYKSLFNLDDYYFIKPSNYKGEIIDLHCDTITRMYHSNENLFENNLHLDIKKMFKSNYLMQCFALFLKKDKGNLRNQYETYKDFYNKCLEKYNQYIVPIKSVEDINIAASSKRIGAMLTIEEGDLLDGDLNYLDKLYEDGVRMITLTWNYSNCIGEPAINLGNLKSENKSLTKFGRELISKMNEIGMIIDVSHLSDDGFYEVIKLSKKPIIASHSSSRFINPSKRNLSDDMILALKNNGGLMGINYCYDFLMDDDTESTYKGIAKHLKHIKDLGCLKHVGLGSDFDGIPTLNDVQDVSKIYKLKETLIQEGFTKSEIEDIFKNNFIRVIKKILK